VIGSQRRARDAGVATRSPVVRRPRLLSGIGFIVLAVGLLGPEGPPPMPAAV